MPNRCIVETPFGNLVAYSNNDPCYPGLTIELDGNETDILCVIEIPLKQDEYFKPVLPEEPENGIQVRVYDDPDGYKNISIPIEEIQEEETLAPIILEEETIILEEETIVLEENFNEEIIIEDNFNNEEINEEIANVIEEKNELLVINSKDVIQEIVEKDEYQSVTLFVNDNHGICDICKVRVNQNEEMFAIGIGDNSVGPDKIYHGTETIIEVCNDCCNDIHQTFLNTENYLRANN